MQTIFQLREIEEFILFVFMLDALKGRRADQVVLIYIREILAITVLISNRAERATVNHRLIHIFILVFNFHLLETKRAHIQSCSTISSSYTLHRLIYFEFFGFVFSPSAAGWLS